ncbi:Ig-like domain-containing protein [Luteolibacter pohnpeiensis]|nr:Ig-like domain-containing protein [Luteolibacter pohnpeiensis]
MNAADLTHTHRFCAISTLALAMTCGLGAAEQPTVADLSPANDAIRVPVDATLSVAASDADAGELTVKFFGRRVGSADPADEFSVIALPDTQFYSENKNGDRAAIFSAQTDWIVAERDALNIGFVLHLGDVSQNGDRVDTAPEQWKNASDAMYRLEDPDTTERNEGVPYVMAVGNHDQTPIGDADGTTIGFNTWFGVHPETHINHFAGKSYYGGTSEPSTADNNFCLFTAGGMDFIVISLEYDTTPDAADLQWADDLLKAYPGRRGIVITHHLVNTGNPAAFSPLGAAIYEKLKSNPNLILMHGGHVDGEGQRTDYYEGRAIHSLLADYQGRTNGGDGWLRIMKFRPLLNRIDVQTYSPSLDRYETDEDSQFSLDVNLKGGMGPFTEIATVTGTAGTLSGNWNELEAGTRYEWYATVSDGTTTVASSVQSFITGGVQFPPVVEISKPGNGAVVESSSNLTLEATASDLDGTIAKVEFYDGTRLIGAVDQPPYRFDWLDVPTGSHTVIAKATDNDGVVGASLPIAVQVVTKATPPDTSTSSTGLLNPGWSIAATTPAPYQFTSPGSNVGDISLRINGNRIMFDSGIIAASNWESPDNGSATSNDNIVSPYKSTDGYAWINNYDNSNPNASDANPTCTEESAGTAVGFFSYQAGWVGAAISSEGSIISSNLPDGVSIYHGDKGLYQIYGLSTAGNLLAFPNGNGGLSGDNVISTRSSGGVWTVDVRDNGSSAQDGDFSFLYIPEGTSGVLSGIMKSDGTIEPLNVDAESVNITGTKSSTSQELLVGNGSVIHPGNSVLFLTGDSTASLNVSDNIHSWSADGNRFQILSQDLPQLNGNHQAVDLRFLIVPLEASPTTVQVETSDSVGGEFREDDRLAIMFHREGPTGASLPVSFTVKGTATPGQDTKLIPTSVMIPAGSDSAELEITILNDQKIEGTENLTFQIVGSTGYRIGAKSSATVEIQDRPLQDYLHVIQSDGPLADQDGDGQPDLIEYFLGSNAKDSSDTGVILAERRNDGAFVVRFPHAKVAVDVTAVVEWSTDLANWFREGELNKSTSASIQTEVVSKAEEDPEQLVAVLTFTPQPPASSVFARLAVTL